MNDTATYEAYGRLRGLCLNLNMLAAFMTRDELIEYVKERAEEIERGRAPLAPQELPHA